MCPPRPRSLHAPKDVKAPGGLKHGLRWNRSACASTGQRSENHQHMTTLASRPRSTLPILDRRSHPKRRSPDEEKSAAQSCADHRRLIASLPKEKGGSQQPTADSAEALDQRLALRPSKEGRSARHRSASVANPCLNRKIEPQTPEPKREPLARIVHHHVLARARLRRIEFSPAMMASFAWTIGCPGWQSVFRRKRLTCARETTAHFEDPNKCPNLKLLRRRVSN